MSPENLSPETANETSAGSQMAAGPRTCYVEAAPLTDVMFEQLEYLIAHQSSNCPSECADCRRLAQVQSCLLIPFGAISPAPALN